VSLSLVSFAFRSSSSPQSSLTPPPFPLLNTSFSQTHLWGERLQLSAATPFKTEQLKMYASRGSESFFCFLRVPLVSSILADLFFLSPSD